MVRNFLIPITRNDSTIATVNLLLLSITGDTAGTVTVDYSNGDPLPTSGLFADSQSIDLTGGSVADTLITTSTTEIFQNASVGDS